MLGKGLGVSQGKKPNPIRKHPGPVWPHAYASVSFGQHFFLSSSSSVVAQDSLKSGSACCLSSLSSKILFPVLGSPPKN